MSQDRTEKLSTIPIPRLLLSMCSQTTMSVMLFSLYSLADTFFVARGVGAHAAGAVALSAPVVQIIGAFASTVGAGGASIISRALGKKDMEEAGVHVSRFRCSDVCGFGRRIGFIFKKA